MTDVEVKPVIERGSSAATLKAKVYRRGVVMVKNIPKYLENHDLWKWAGQFGEVKRACCWKQKPLSKPTTRGYVEFASRDAAKIIAEKMTGTIMMGKPLKLIFCEDIGFETANRLFPRDGHDLKPVKTVRDIVQEEIERRHTIVVDTEAEAASIGRDFKRPCAGTATLRAAGIKCDWVPFTTLDEALVGLAPQQ